jgi:hypothetical protein
MQIYDAMPSMTYSWATSSIDRMRRARQCNQSSVTQVLWARVELIRLFVFTAIELAVHVVTALAKFTFAVIELPLYPFVGVSPKRAFIDGCMHTVRSVKLALMLLCAPGIGCVDPDWCIGLYRRFSLINEPKGWMQRVSACVGRWARCAWTTPILLPALAGAALGAISGRHRFYRAVEALPIPSIELPTPSRSWFWRYLFAGGMILWALRRQTNQYAEGYVAKVPRPLPPQPPGPPQPPAVPVTVPPPPTRSREEKKGETPDGASEIPPTLRANPWLTGLKKDFVVKFFLLDGTEIVGLYESLSVDMKSIFVQEHGKSNPSSFKLDQVDPDKYRGPNSYLFGDQLAPSRRTGWFS